MDKTDEVKVKKLIHRLGLKYNLRDEEIKQIINSPFEFAAEKYREMDLKSITTEDELDNLKTTFLFKGFGKLFVSYALINRRNKQKQNSFKLNNKWKK